MNIKRALISVLALMMLPTVAMAQIPVTPADGTALLFIQKVFTDGNNETPVTLNLQCTNGQPNQSTVTVYPDDPFQQAGIFGQMEVGFVIDNIAIVGGEGATCTVTEAPVAGYEINYICGPGSDSDPADHCLPDATGPDANEIACEWSDIQSNETNGDEVGDVNRCLITNDVLPVPVEVTKVWDISNAGGDFFSRDVTVRIACTDEIVDFDDIRGPFYEKFFPLSESDFVADGEATVTAYVYPRFDRADENRRFEVTRCWADENIQDSAVEIENDCGTSPPTGQLHVTAGQGDSCTITNTLFFEGIPTLSQYGMAIMALLMLGVGFIGFRRFV